MATVRRKQRIPDIDPMFFWEFDLKTMDWDKAYKTVIGRIIERGDQEEVDELVRFYGNEKILNALRNEIYFLPDYAIDRAIDFFPELKKEQMYCYLNRKDKPYHWI